MTILPALLVGYLLGSVPFGLILTRLFHAGDLRAIGSGNIGATNVLRTGHKGLAFATFALDGLKGLAAVLLARALWPGSEGWAAAAAIVGHCFPVWLGFRGGKGVATLFGVAFGLAWPIGTVCFLAWVAVAALTRYSSLAGMVAAVTTPVVAWLLGREDYAVVLAGIAVLVLWQHRENIARLRRGTESKIGSRK